MSFQSPPLRTEIRKLNNFPFSPSLPHPSPSLFPSGRGLRISQVQLEDSGIFTCVAASPAGVADRNFTLLVLGMGKGGAVSTTQARTDENKIPNLRLIRVCPGRAMGHSNLISSILCSFIPQIVSKPFSQELTGIIYGNEQWIWAPAPLGGQGVQLGDSSSVGILKGLPMRTTDCAKIPGDGHLLRIDADLTYTCPPQSPPPWNQWSFRTT